MSSPTSTHEYWFLPARSPMEHLEKQIWPLPLLGKRSPPQEFAKMLTQKKRNSYFLLLLFALRKPEMPWAKKIMATFYIFFLSNLEHHPAPQHLLAFGAYFKIMLRGMELEKREHVKERVAEETISVYKGSWHCIWWRNEQNSIPRFESVYFTSRDLSRETLLEMPQFRDVWVAQ